MPHRRAIAKPYPLADAAALSHQGGVPAPRISVLPVADPAALAGDWRALEGRAEVSFFQSWSWVGCRVAARFPRPWLLRAEAGGETVALALCNRAGGALWLGEAGDAGEDAVYVEHNGPLLAREAAALLPACLGALLRPRLCLSGVGADQLAAARAVGAVRLRRTSRAPFVDFSALGAGEDAFLGSLSANARAQLRRSDRAYASAGPIEVARAATLAEALSFLDALAGLHQATWRARGRPGAFANPAFGAFHRELLARALPRGEVELLRVAAGGRAIGYLYNFRHRGRVLAYQSGFDYAAAPAHGKPGLTCHHAAIALARREGAGAYDFLAGEDRYKTSLSNAATELFWLEAARRWSLRGLAYRAERLIRG